MRSRHRVQEQDIAFRVRIVNVSWGNSRTIRTNIYKERYGARIFFQIVLLLWNIFSLPIKVVVNFKLNVAKFTFCSLLHVTLKIGLLHEASV